MNILLFVLVPFLAVAAYAGYVWLRNREPTSLESGVDAFRREMDALSPSAAPGQRRPERVEDVAFGEADGGDPAPRRDRSSTRPGPSVRPQRRAPRRPDAGDR